MASKIAGMYEPTAPRRKPPKKSEHMLAYMREHRKWKAAQYQLCVRMIHKDKKQARVAFAIALREEAQPWQGHFDGYWFEEDTKGNVSMWHQAPMKQQGGYAPKEDWQLTCHEVVKMFKFDWKRLGL